MISKEEQERFIELMLPVRHRLMHFARVIAGDNEEARDLASDTIAAALHGFARIRQEESFLGYLFATAIRIHRRRSARRRLFVRYDAKHHEQSTTSSSSEASAEARMLYAAMAKLPEKQRETVALFELSGLTLEEIREIQGGSLSGVKMRLVRGRAELARLLGMPERISTKSTLVDQATAIRTEARDE